jgi:hypothetical protein
MEPPPETTRPGLNDLSGPLVQLHIAEYQALTTRSTYWITIQMSVWALVLIYLTLVTSIWSKDSSHARLLVWGSGIVIQLCLAGWYYAGNETYRNVFYIEHELRSLIQTVIGPQNFWKYEAFLAKRSGRKPVWSDTAPCIFLVLGFGTVVCIRRPFSGAELWGFLLNMALTVHVIRQAYILVIARRRFQALVS